MTHAVLAACVGLAGVVGCGGGAGPGIDASQGNVELAVATVDCSGPLDSIAAYSGLCDQVFSQMTWYRDGDDVIVDIGDDDLIEIRAHVGADADPTSDYSASVSYDAEVHHGSTVTPLAGSIVTETLVPSCDRGRFRAAGALVGGDVTFQVAFEAYPSDACTDSGSGGGGVGGAGGAGG